MNNNDTRIPNKVITMSVDSVASGDVWSYDDNTPYWSGGSTPRPYQYIINASVNTQPHSSNLTREPYEYNGLDIFKGDWIAEGSSGKVFYNI